MNSDKTTWIMAIVQLSRRRAIEIIIWKILLNLFWIFDCWVKKASFELQAAVCRFGTGLGLGRTSEANVCIRSSSTGYWKCCWCRKDYQAKLQIIQCPGDRCTFKTKFLWRTSLEFLPNILQIAGGYSTQLVMWPSINALLFSRGPNYVGWYEEIIAEYTIKTNWGFVMLRCSDAPECGKSESWMGTHENFELLCFHLKSDREAAPHRASRSQLLAWKRRRRGNWRGNWRSEREATLRDALLLSRRGKEMGSVHSEHGRASLH